MIKRNSKNINVHSITQQLSLKFGTCQKWEPAGRIGDFGNCFNFFVKSPLLPLLHIQLTISFLIGRKRTVNFRNQRLGHHLAADYTTIMSTTLKVKGNHVMYDRGSWFLRVIKFARFVLLAVTEEAKTWLPGLLRRPSKTSKKYLKTRTHKTQKGRRRWQRSCLLITWKKKNWENLRYFSRLEISLNYQFHLLSWPFFVFSFNV